MTNMSAPTAPVRSGDPGSELRQRSPYATRRRVFVLVSLIVVLAVAALANYGPLRGYVDARERLQEAATGLATLEQQKADLQAQLGKLMEAGYLESLAREELTYARPGEDLYIITGSDEQASPYGVFADDAAGAETASGGNAAGTDTDVEETGLLREIISSFEALD